MRKSGQTDHVMENALEQVEKSMRKMARNVSKDRLTGAVIKSALAVPGKMLRPQILILSACLINENEAMAHMEHLIRWAAIIELSHTASLIHDDVIDQSYVRRGIPTVMKRYDNSSAIYAGDYLLASILREILKSHEGDKALLLVDGIEEMCAGEINQTHCKYRQNVTIEQYNKNIAGKTGVLFASACRLGAMEVTGQQDIIRQYEEFGRKLGRAFQLRDDLLDIMSSQTEAGKMVMQDFQEGIYTLPVLLARDHDTYGFSVKKLMKKNKRGNLTEKDKECLKEILLKSQAVAKVEEETARLLEECKSVVRESSCQWARDKTEAILDRLKNL